jgi:hypothetical protein
VYTNSYDASLNARNGFPVFSTLVEANHIQKTEDLYAAYKLTDEDKHEIHKLARDPRIGAPSYYYPWGVGHALRGLDTPEAAPAAGAPGRPDKDNASGIPLFCGDRNGGEPPRCPAVPLGPSWCCCCRASWP